MEIKPFASIAAGALLAALLFTGCGSTEPEAAVDFPHLTINQKPATLIMDTGSDSSLIFQPGRVGLTMAKTTHDWPVNGQSVDGFGLSDPANISFGSQSITAPLSVMQDPPWFMRWVLAWLMGSDGLISWSEVKDNILVFDSEQHVVRAVPELPPAAAGWLQLKVRRSGPLTLEIPLPDGSTGTILVDTGQPYGVSLSPAQWKAWNTANPHAPFAMRLFAMIGSDLSEVKESWADNIEIGPLTITDVPVHPALGVEWAGDAFHYSGTLGMYGLTRVDLIVDGKKGIAYLHPKPPPGLPYPGIKRANEPGNLPNGDSKWTIDPSVRLASDNFWLDSAGVKVNIKDYAGALVDVSRALELNPNNPSAYDTRGGIKLCQGDATGASTDYDHAITLDSQAAGFYNDRGFIKEVRGDWAAALADYNQSLAMDPQDANAFVNRGDTEQSQGGFLDALNDYEWAGDWQPGGWPDTAYAVLHSELLRRQLGFPAADLTSMLTGWKDSWVKSIGEFISGSLTETAFMTAATKDDTGAPADAVTLREQKAEAEYYLGMMRLLQGDVPAAREHWQKCVTAAVLSLGEYTLAQDELALTDNSSPAQSQNQRLFSASKKYAAGEYTGASADFSQALTTDPTCASAFYYRGICRFNLGDNAGAIADLTQAIALEPQNFLAYENRGVAKDFSGDHAGATADYAQAFALDPQNATVDPDDEFARENKGDYRGAVTFHTQEINTDGKEDVPDDYAARGRTEQMQGDFTEALADYKQASALDPDGTPYTQLNRQFLHLRLGQTPPDISKDVMRWKDDWLKALGQFATGKLDQAALLTLARSGGNDLDVLQQLCEADYYIGQLHLVKGDDAGAREFWQKALATNQLGYDPVYLLARAELAGLKAAPKN